MNASASAVFSAAKTRAAAVVSRAWVRTSSSAIAFQWRDRSGAVGPEQRDRPLLGAEGLGDAVDLLQVGLEGRLPRARRRRRPKQRRILDVPRPNLSPARQKRWQEGRRRRNPVLRADRDRPRKRGIRPVVLGSCDELLADAPAKREATSGVGVGSSAPRAQPTRVGREEVREHSDCGTVHRGVGRGRGL